MKVVLLAAADGRELSPLTQAAPAALLPVADKPLLIHAVESLAMAGLTDVIVAPASSEIKKALGDGAQWGIRFEHMAARPGESADGALGRLAAELNQDHLLVRGDVLRTPIVAEFLDRAAQLGAAAAIATIAGKPAGLEKVRRGSPPLARDSASDFKPRREGASAIDFPDARLSLIESPAAFHRANLDAIAGRFPGLILPGRQLLPRVMVGRKTRLPREAIKGAPILVGSRCRIAASAELMPETVVSSGSVIDRNATLHRAVIMPHTYVGELIEITDAIVAGQWLIHVDSGAPARITDSFLLSSMGRGDVTSILRNAAARTASAIMLALSPRQRVSQAAGANADRYPSQPPALANGNRLKHEPDIVGESQRRIEAAISPATDEWRNGRAV